MNTDTYTARFYPGDYNQPREDARVLKEEDPGKTRGDVHIPNTSENKGVKKRGSRPRRSPTPNVHKGDNAGSASHRHGRPKNAKAKGNTRAGATGSKYRSRSRH